MTLSQEYTDIIMAENSVDIQHGLSTEADVVLSHEAIVDKAIRLIKAGFTKDIEVELALSEMIGALADKCTVTMRTIAASVKEAHQQIDCNGLGKFIVPCELTEGIYDFYKNGYDTGMEISGWYDFSRLFRVAKRELTIVTGIPGHGKSEFVDDLMMGLMTKHYLKFGIFSPENYPHEIHIEKMLSKLYNKPFHKGRNDRLTEMEIAQGLNTLSSFVSFIVPDENDLSLDAILAIALRIKKEKGLDFLLIDPWNEIENNRDKAETETDYIGRSLMKCRRFARKNDIAFFIVAHPLKMQKDKDGVRPVPTPYDISGSSHWFNKADNCLCVYRNIDTVDVHVQKIKFKIRGQVGCASFKYDVVSGRYTEINKQEEI